MTVSTANSLKGSVEWRISALLHFILVEANALVMAHRVDKHAVA
jgi:hypothetical protein